MTASSIDTEITNLSNHKLVYIIRLSDIENVAMDSDFIDRVKQELIIRDQFGNETTGNSSH